MVIFRLELLSVFFSWKVGRETCAGKPPTQLRKADLATRAFRQSRLMRQSDSY